MKQACNLQLNQLNFIKPYVLLAISLDAIYFKDNSFKVQIVLLDE